MRKVKVLALLLAALMVVAVFAGCADTDAIVADVDSLEDRVTALEGLLNDQKDAIDDVKDQIGDVSDKLDDDTTADQLAATLEALKQLQEAMNAQNEQIKDLADKVTKVEEDAKESDENADDDAALQAAVKVYTAQLQELKITCELKKELYIPADYEAVVKALSDGIVAVAAAEKADDAKAAFEAAKAVYDAKAIVSSKLAALYAQVNNSITADSKALIDEIRAYIYDDTTKTPAAKCPVTVKYEKYVTETDITKVPAELLVDNIIGKKDANGKAVKVNVIVELKNAVAAYDYLTNADKANTFANNVKAAVDAIADIKTVVYDNATEDAYPKIKTAQDKLNVVKNDIVADVNAKGETTNTKYAPYLADSIMEQVTNAAVLTAAEARKVELAVAAAMYDTYVALATGKTGKIFEDYTKLSDTEKVLYTNKPVYDAVDALLNKWADAYKLEAENVEAIVNVKEGADFYYGYLKNKLTTELSVKAYTDFAAIANRIEALNKLTTVNAANVTEYGEITKAIQNWVVLQKASTAENATRLEKEPIQLSVANVAKILEAYELPVTALTFNDKGELTNMFELTKITDDAVKAFFKDQYVGLKAEYDAVNKNIKKLAGDKTASTKYTDIKRHVELEGIYKLNDKGQYVVNTAVSTEDKVKIDGESLTIAAFLKKYEKYDLSSLIDLADFEAAKEYTTARIAGFKAGAANISDLVEKVAYVALQKDDKGNVIRNKAATKAMIEAGNFYYYVNLSDAAAVEAANAAYAAWIKSGATISLKEWVPAVDEKGEVLKDTYVFASIADKAALDALTQMNDDIAALKDAAAKVVAHFELVAEIWNQNKALALNATAEKQATVDAILELVPAYLDGGVVEKVSYAYPVVVADAKNALAAYSFTFDNKTIVLAYKSSAVKTSDLEVTNLQTLIDTGYKAYQAFLAMNADLTVKTANGDYVFDKAKKVEDSAVKAAIDGIADAETVMLKDYAVRIVNGSKMSATEATIFCGYINAIDSVSSNGSQLFNIAQELYARHGVQIAAKQRGGETGYLGNTSFYDYTQVFRAPTYTNIG